MKKYINVVLIVIVLFIGLISLTGCNRALIDTNHSFDKCITYIGDEKIEIEIKKWQDYDGEQIQITSKDGKIYLVSMNNSILIKE